MWILQILSSPGPKPLAPNPLVPSLIFLVASLKKIKLMKRTLFLIFWLCLLIQYIEINHIYQFTKYTPWIYMRNRVKPRPYWLVVLNILTTWITMSFNLISLLSCQFFPLMSRCPQVPSVPTLTFKWPPVSDKNFTRCKPWEKLQSTRYCISSWARPYRPPV